MKTIKVKIGKRRFGEKTEKGNMIKIEKLMMLTEKKKKHRILKTYSAY